jgi:hypothetical protein
MGHEAMPLYMMIVSKLTTQTQQSLTTKRHGHTHVEPRTLRDHHDKQSNALGIQLIPRCLSSQTLKQTPVKIKTDGANFTTHDAAKPLQ